MFGHIDISDLDLTNDEHEQSTGVKQSTDERKT